MKVRDSVVRQLARRGGLHVVITSNLPTRIDGRPINSATDDPGIAVYWTIAPDKTPAVEHVIACDKWKNAALNLSAIDRTLTAMRGIERWGSAEMIDRSYAGFLALPVGTPAPMAPNWREVLGGVWPEELDNGALLAIAKARYRTRIADAHPDRGGSQAISAELGRAMSEAEAELT